MTPLPSSCCLGVHGDLDRGRYVVAKKRDLDAGILFSLLLQIKLHKAVVHTVRGTGCSQEINLHFLGERLNHDTTSFHQSNPRTGEQERVKAIQTVSCEEGLVAGTGEGHQWAGVLQGTDVEVYCPHVITDQVIVTCVKEGRASRLVLASIDKVVHMSNRNPDTQI